MVRHSKCQLFSILHPAMESFLNKQKILPISYFWSIFKSVSFNYNELSSLQELKQSICQWGQSYFIFYLDILYWNQYTVQTFKTHTVWRSFGREVILLLLMSSLPRLVKWGCSSLITRALMSSIQFSDTSSNTNGLSNFSKPTIVLQVDWIIYLQIL